MIPIGWRAGATVAIAGLCGGCAGKPPTVVPASLEVDWQPFRWAEITVGGGAVISRASILVETTDSTLLRAGESGSPLTQLQLDFGFSGNGEFGIPLRTFQPIPTDSASARRIFRGTVPWLGNRDDSTGTRASYRLGTVGLLFYGIKGLLIDQVEQRLGAPRASRPLPADLVSRMQWSDAREDAGRLRIPLARQADRLGDLWYDPGSSLVPLLVGADAWHRLTGRSESDRSNRTIVLPLVGDSVVLVGAPVVDGLTLGGIALGEVMVYRVLTGPADRRPDRFSPGVVGVLGNQAFARARLLYVNVRAKRLGVAF